MVSKSCGSGGRYGYCVVMPLVLTSRRFRPPMFIGLNALFSNNSTVMSTAGNITKQLEIY